MLREASGFSDSTPVDVAAILDCCPIQWAELPLDGFLGVYVPHPRGDGILIKEGQTPEQRRFTIAHELGHFALPRHGRDSQLVCLSDDFFAAAVSRELEREANEFAAELLMPRSLFGAAIADRDPTLALARTLADRSRFWVSLTAASIRLVELNAEPCALVCSKAGRIQWWVKSRAFKYFLCHDIGRRTPPGSVAAAVFAGETPNDRAEEVEPAVWLSHSGNGIGVYESTFASERFDQILSLIWVVEEDE